MICIWSSWSHCHPIISCSSKIQNGLPLWCQLTRVFLEKRPLNGCSSSSSSSSSSDRPTDHAAQSVTFGRILAHSTAMRPNNDSNSNNSNNSKSSDIVLRCWWRVLHVDGCVDQGNPHCVFVFVFAAELSHRQNSDGVGREQDPSDVER